MSRFIASIGFYVNMVLNRSFIFAFTLYEEV